MKTRHVDQKGRQLAPGDPAPDVTVLDITGQAVRLSEAWHAGPVLLTFLRHFG